MSFGVKGVYNDVARVSLATGLREGRILEKLVNWIEDFGSMNRHFDSV